MKSLAYMSLVCLILENGALCWDPYRECQINMLHRVKKKAAKFANHTNNLGWETLPQHRKRAAFASCSKHTLEDGHGNL